MGSISRSKQMSEVGVPVVGEVGVGKTLGWWVHPAIVPNAMTDVMSAVNLNFFVNIVCYVFGM